MTSFIKLRDFLINAATTKSNDPLVYKTLYNNFNNRSIYNNLI